MTFILSFLATSIGRWVAIAAGASVLVGGFAYQQQRKGEASAVAKIERATNERTSKAAIAGRKSADPLAPGLRNPNYRD